MYIFIFKYILIQSLFIYLNTKSVYWNRIKRTILLSEIFVCGILCCGIWRCGILRVWNFACGIWRVEFCTCGIWFLHVVFYFLFLVDSSLSNSVFENFIGHLLETIEMPNNGGRVNALRYLYGYLDFTRNGVRCCSAYQRKSKL